MRNLDVTVEGSLPEDASARCDTATGIDLSANERAGRWLGRRRPSLRTASQPETGSRKERRSLGSAIATILKRLWIPLVILAVLGAGGFTVSRLHNIFGSDKSVPYSDSNIANTEPFNPKFLRYEIFGPPGTVADISYFDGNGEPQSEDKAVLPWSFEFPMTGTMGIASIAAQGDSDSIGCRIVVDGVLKDENIVTHEVSSFTACRPHE